MKICPYCQVAINDDVRECPYCGKPQELPVADPSSNNPPEYFTVPSQKVLSVPPSIPPLPKEKNKGVTIFLIILSVIYLAFIVFTVIASINTWEEKEARIDAGGYYGSSWDDDYDSWHSYFQEDFFEDEATSFFGLAAVHFVFACCIGLGWLLHFFQKKVASIIVSSLFLVFLVPGLCVWIFVM